MALKPCNRSRIGPRELLIRSLQDETQQVLVSVTDCGVGFSAENADRLFNAFFTTKTNGPWGMGLSICRSIIEAHGGRLWASANLPPRCKRFQFTLPVSAKHCVVRLRKPSKEQKARPKHDAECIGRLRVDGRPDAIRL